MGQANITVNIRDIETRTVAFVVTELREDVILGLAWLTEQNTIVETAARRIHFGRRERRTVYNLDPRPQVTTTINLDDLDHSVPPEYRERMQKMLNERRDVFASADPLRRTNITEHAIETDHDRPLFVPPRGYLQPQAKIIKEQIAEMIADGVIEPSDSRYNSQITLAPKKDGTWRFCVDLRPLNLITKPAAPPYISVKTALNMLGNAKVMTSLDLRSGYWQIPVKPEHRHKTAFTAPDGGRYQFCAMPFGLKCAPSTFQAMMVRVLDGLIGECVVAYLDDVVVWSQTWEEHIQHLSLVLERLAINGLVCANHKCHIGKPQIKFLGHIVNEEGNKPDREQLRLIEEYSPPRTRKQVRKFFGLINWLREYIQDFAVITAPLTALMSPNVKFTWTPAAAQSFTNIKASFRACKTLARHDPSKPIYVQTDASEQGIGAVLFQLGEKGEYHILEYSSAKFGPVERRYDVNERECLAVVWAFKRYRPYLEYQRFTLRTDNRCLVWLHNTHEARSKLTRWSLLLQSFDFHVEHVSGAENQLADALSRSPDPTTLVRDEDEWDEILPPGPRDINESTPTCAQTTLTEQTHIDQLYEAIVKAQQTAPDATAKRQQCGQRTLDRWRVIDERLETRVNTETGVWKLFVPRTERTRVLEFMHDSQQAGHPGSRQTARNIIQYFYWPGIACSVRSHVRECLPCNHFKARRTDGNQQQTPRIPTEPFDTIALDIMGPYPKTARGKRFIVVITDLFSRWPEAYAVNKARVSNIAAILENEFFPRWGYPRKILSDNGTQFKGKKWRDLCTKWGVTAHTTPVHHPRANPTERRNQDLKIQLRLRLRGGKEHTQWAEYLPQALFTIRRRTNEATGYSPAALLQGRNLPLPGEFRCPATPRPAAPEGGAERSARQQTNIVSARDNQAQYAKKWVPTTTRPPKPVQIGRKVFAKEHLLSAANKNFCASLGPKWSGPHEILEVLGPTTYVIRTGPRKTRKVHRDSIRLAKRPDTPDTQADPEQRNETEAPTPELQTTQRMQAEPPQQHDQNSTHEPLTLEPTEHGATPPEDVGGTALVQDMIGENYDPVTITMDWTPLTPQEGATHREEAATKPAPQRVARGPPTTSRKRQRDLSPSKRAPDGEDDGGDPGATPTRRTRRQHLTRACQCCAPEPQGRASQPKRRRRVQHGMQRVTANGELRTTRYSLRDRRPPQKLTCCT